MQGEPAQITVTRRLPSDIGIREVHIYLDGQMIASLKHKQAITREVLPGHHSLRAHNTLVGKTLEFDLRPGEHLRFTTSNRSGCATSLIFILGAGPIYISFDREEEAPAEGQGPLRA